MSTEAIAVCPNCAQRLVLGERTVVTQVRCAQCGWQFEPTSGVRAAAKLNRWAIGSLALGLSSLVGAFVTGVPAIIFGAWALKQIRLDKDTRGRGMAITGITLGVVLSLTCGPLWLTVANIATSIRRTKDPEQVAEWASELASFELPRGMKPREAHSALGIRVVEYQGESVEATISIGSTPASVGQSRQMQRSIVADRHPGKVVEESVFLHEPFEVTKQRCMLQDSPDVLRHYFAVVETKRGLTTIQVKVRDVAEPEPDVHPLTDEQVRRFFESVRLVP